MSEFPDTTLVIAGHGSSKSPNQALPARQHAAYIQRLGLFEDVKTTFWKEPPFLKDILSDIHTKRIVIVPNLACSGHINKVVIPCEMGLEGEITKKDDQEILLCSPVGEYPALPELIALRLKEVLNELGLAPQNTTVFLTGHGNPNPNRPASHDSTVLMALKIFQHFQLHAILPAFIEEKPLLSDWERRTECENILILPFMIAAGIHGARDIPEQVGINPSQAQWDVMLEKGTPAGPFIKEGRKIWLMRAMGSHPRIADFIVNLAREKLTGLS